MSNPRTLNQNRHLYRLFSEMGILDNKDAIAEIVLSATNGRTTHSSQLSFIECQQLINSLQSKVSQSRYNEDMDRKRKGLIKAIARWYELQNKAASLPYIKATACRAAGVDDFNRITSAALSRLYAEFCRKQRAQEVMNSEENVNNTMCIDITESMNNEPKAKA